jgi:hypothetical protein
VKELILDGRMLGRRNARPGALRSDFARIGLEDVLNALAHHDSASSRRWRRLEQLNVWRNAIAHQDLPLSVPLATTVAGTSRTLPWARLWRSDCAALAHDLDAVVSHHLTDLLGKPPW